MKAWFMTGSTCECAATGFFEYYNISTLKYSCETCSPLCASCTGPFINQCTSCRSGIGAIMIAGNICTCADRYFYDPLLEECKECSVLCGSCFGYGADQCYSCDTAVAYSFEGNTSLCVTDCHSYPGRYIVGRECKGTPPLPLITLVSMRLRLQGMPGSEQHLLSGLHKWPSLVAYAGGCLESCPSHHYASLGICYGKL